MGPEYKVIEDTLIVYPPQELDHHSAFAVKQYSEEIIRKGMIKNIIFDFSNTTLMDSSGVGMIMGRYRLIQEKSGYIGVRGVSAAIHRILEISGLYKLVKVCE